MDTQLEQRHANNLNATHAWSPNISGQYETVVTSKVDICNN